MGLLVKVGSAVNQKNIGFGGTHNKTFLAIDDEMIVFQNRGCRGTKKVRTTSWFRQCFSTDEPALQDRFEEFFFLGLGSKYVQCFTDDGGHHKCASQRSSQDTDFLFCNDLCGPGQTASAPLWIEAQAQKVFFGQFCHVFTWVFNFILIHGANQIRGYVITNKGPDFRLDGLFLMGHYAVVKHVASWGNLTVATFYS